MTGFFLLIFVLALNLWIWKIFSAQFVIGAILIISSILLYISVTKNSSRVFIFFLILLLVLLFYQYRFTESYSLTNLDNDEQRVQSQRLKEYPPIHIQILNRHIWFLGEDFFEERNEFLVFTRMSRNFIDNLDINKYFFGGYPRQMAAKIDFEKFPFIFLPFFVIGLIISIKKQNIKYFLLIYLLLLLTSFIGNRNKLGLFSMFPFFVLFIVLGVQFAYQYIRNWGARKTFVISTFFLVLASLSFVQQIIYEQF